MSRRLLVLAEREAGCAARLVAAGFRADVAGEIAAYLSQATDLSAFEAPIREAMAAAGIEVRYGDPTGPEAWLDWLRERPAETVVWPVTDGIRYYRGSHASALARLLGARLFGAPPALQHLAQDKFKCGAAAIALGVPVPATGLLRDGRWLGDPPPGDGPWFVKPAIATTRWSRPTFPASTSGSPTWRSSRTRPYDGWEYTGWRPAAAERSVARS